MVKAIIASLAMIFAVNAHADANVDGQILATQVATQFQTNVQGMVTTEGLNWKVGDTCSYNVDMTIIKGTMVMSVKSIGADGIWMEQNMDLGIAGKQDVQSLIDPNTGAIKKMIVNGQEQQVPKQDVKVISTKEENVTVPAGTFDSLHVVMQDQSGQTKGNIDVWINPKAIPLSGMAKTIQPSQFGNVTVELTSFHKM